MVTATDEDDNQIVTVLPITHTPPDSLNPLVIEIPVATKKRLGLDDARSWIVLTEANRFIWPGPDLRPVHSGNRETVIHGQLPDKFFERVKLAFLAALKDERFSMVRRTE